MGSTATRPAGDHCAELAYEAIAPVYDDFTAHHDNEAWLAELVRALRRRGLSGRRLLDVGCGTGKSFLPMLERGWRVTGCDVSPSMLDLAAAKAGPAAMLHVADMRELPKFGGFDLVWALDDAVNYLLSGEELRQALQRMRTNLAPGGLLMFDLNTLHSYRTFFAETATVERGGRRMVWRGRASAEVPSGAVCEARFEVHPAGGGPAVDSHLHRQRHFPVAEVLKALRSAELECLDVFGQGYDGVLRKPLRELTHAKAVYLARPAPACSFSAWQRGRGRVSSTPTNSSGREKGGGWPGTVGPDHPGHWRPER